MDERMNVRMNEEWVCWFCALLRPFRNDTVRRQAVRVGIPTAVLSSAQGKSMTDAVFHALEYPLENDGENMYIKLLCVVGSLIAS
jgi:hypothetical protein